MEDSTFLNKEKGEMGNWIAIHEYHGQVLVGVNEAYDFISKKEAIDLAHAIIAHFNKDQPK